MKQLKYYMMILAAIGTLGSCSDDNEPAVSNAGNDEIALSADTLQVTKAGGTVSVTVTSSSDWRLSGTCDWVHPSAMEGKSGENVTFTVNENTTEEDLHTTFKFFTGSSVAPLVIESLQGYMLNLVTDNTMELEKDEGQVAIRLKGNVDDFSVSCSQGSEEWLTVSGQREFGSEKIVLIDVDENITYLQRSAVITISSPFIGEAINVTLSQAPTELFEITLDNLENNLLICDLAEQNLQFKVVTNLEFTTEVTEGNDWINGPQISDPETAANGLSTYRVTYNLESSTGTRAGTIQFKANELSKDISVIQKAPNVELVDISEDLSSELISWGWIMPVGTQYIVLEEGLNATVFESDEWIYDMTGIENFPNLESISFNCDADIFDISGLHKVKEVKIKNAYYLKTYNFGDNPITSYNMGDSREYCYTYTITFISEKLETLNCNVENYDWGYTRTLDVSGCPALKTLVADECCSDLRTIIVKEGQDITIIKPDDVTIEYK